MSDDGPRRDTMPEPVPSPGPGDGGTRYTILAHTADTGIEATAATLEDLIEVLAGGMFGLVADLTGLSLDTSITVDVTSSSTDELVVDVLAELLYCAEVDDLVLGAFSVEMLGTNAARVTARGVPSEAVSATGPPIKGVTYHDLEVRPTRAGWYGRVYFDV